MRIALNDAVRRSRRPWTVVADLAGVHRAKFLAILNGQEEPSRSERQRIAEVLRVPDCGPLFADVSTEPETPL